MSRRIELTHRTYDELIDKLRPHERFTVAAVSKQTGCRNLALLTADGLIELVFTRHFVETPTHSDSDTGSDIPGGGAA